MLVILVYGHDSSLFFPCCLLYFIFNVIPTNIWASFAPISLIVNE